MDIPDEDEVDEVEAQSGTFKAGEEALDIIIFD